MARFNNFWKMAVLVCLLACLCLTFAACGGDNGGEGNGTGGGDSTTQSTTVGNSTYTISVSTVSGVKLNGISVYVYTDSTMEELETMKPLGADGTISFEALTSDSYVAVLMGVPAGYDVQEYYALTGAETEIVLVAGVITDQEKPEDKIYNLGDVMYDFTITDCNGVEYSLSQLLEEKEAVVLNFWYLNCDPCKLEFPYLEMAYAEFSDRIEVLGINCEDGNDAELQAFAQEFELTFPLAIGDKSYWYPAGYNACPTTIVIDRYGTIVYKHAGYFDEVAPFIAMFRTVTGEDYTPVFIENIEDVITEDDYRPDGTQERPFEMGGVTEFDVKVQGNGLVYYNLYRLTDVTMRIENPNAYVIIDGVKHYPENGVIELLVSSEDTFKPLNVAFGNTSSTKNTIHVEFVFEPGNINNPIELVHGDNEVLVNKVNALGVYYTYSATSNGMLTITVQGCTEGAYATIQMYNENTYEEVYDGVEDPETGLITYSIYVNEGDRVQIIFGAATVDPEAVLPSATIQALASLVEDGGGGVIDGKEGYSVTVVDQNGNPVPGARIQLSSAGQNALLTTNEAGKVTIRLTKDAYFLELAVPSGYVSDVTSFMWSPAMKDLVIQVSTTTSYTVQVQTESGLPQQGVLVWVYEDEAQEKLLYAITTDANGMIAFVGKTGSTFYLTLTNVDETLAVQEVYTTEGENSVLSLEEATATPGYGLGDLVEDFSVTDIDSVTYTLQELLQQKSAVILTFWRTDSPEYIQTLKALQQVYEVYGDQVAILALNPEEGLELELQFYQSLYGLTYPLAKCEPELAQSMGVVSFSTTVVIDGEGRVSLVHTGELSREQGEAVAEFYTAENYTHIAFASIEELMEYITQENPETPENPENPENPDEPETPEEPVSPEEPTDPET